MNSRRLTVRAAFMIILVASLYVAISSPASTSPRQWSAVKPAHKFHLHPLRKARIL